MPQTQDKRDLVAKMKLLPNQSVIRGKRGIFLDDSIVRGTQLKDKVRDLRQAGMKEINMRIACPPLTYPCEFLNFSRSRSSSDLATHKAICQLRGTCEEVDMREYSDHTSQAYQDMVEQIRKDLDLDSLVFQHLEDLVAAIGLPKEKLCTHCWDGSSYF
jgi:amidophosphoribosyltransferase